MDINVSTIIQTGTVVMLTLIMLGSVCSYSAWWL